MPAFKRLVDEYRSKQEDTNDDETQAKLEDLITTQNSLNKVETNSSYNKLTLFMIA